MALKLNERYPGRFTNPSANYPQGSFKNRTSPTAKDGSYLEKDWANDKEGFFQSIVAAAGVIPNGTVDVVGASQNYDSLLKVINIVARKPPILTDTGPAVNSYAASNAVPLTNATLSHGVMQRLQFSRANTGFSVYSPDGLGPFPIYGLNLLQLQGGEISLRGVGDLLFIVDVAVNGGNGAFVLMSCTGAPPSGRLINIKVFSASGTYTPTPGMVTAFFRVQGGGGAGAGLTTPSAGNVSMGAPGCSGSYAEGRFTAAQIGASQAVTVGSGGVAASNTAGGLGGTSSVGSLITAPGGPGGALLNNQVPGVSNGNGATAGTPTGANIFPSIGNCTKLCTSSSASSGQPAGGGDSIFGSGATPPILNGPGISALNYGAGGSGVVAGSGGTAQAGGAGKGGIVIVYEYS